MIREGGDPVIVAQSSIALLQERFKQLQRMKEMRQERQLLKQLAVADDKAFGPPTPPQLYEPLSSLGLSCQKPDLPQLSLSLWPIQPHSRCWLVEKEKQIEPRFFLVEQSTYKDLAHVDEVDTSLHL